MAIKSKTVVICSSSESDESSSDSALAKRRPTLTSKNLPSTAMKPTTQSVSSSDETESESSSSEEDSSDSEPVQQRPKLTSKNPNGKTPINEQPANMKTPTVMAQPLPLGDSSLTASETTADVKEYQDSFVLEIDMAGLKSGDIKVEIEDDNVVVVSGERKREQGVKYLRMERMVGNLLRKFVLPENADVHAVSAVCQDGLLSVTVQKKLPPSKTNKTKRIKVA